MEKITEKQLNYLLKEQQVTVLLQDADGDECEIRPKLGFNETSLEWELEEYYIYGKKIEKYKDYNDVIQFLKENKLFIANEVTVLLIDDRFRRIQFYKEAQEFDALEMRGLIEKYEGIADSFVLVGDCDVTTLPAEAREIARREMLKDIMDRSRESYDSLSEKEKALLPDFETLCAEIREEIRTYEEKHQGEAIFFCDMLINKKTRYKKPQKFLWHLYHDFQRFEDYDADLAELAKEIVPLDAELDLEKFHPLKPHLISVMPTCSWHCTMGGLSKVFRFRLTEETKNWLLQYKTDFDLEELEDLAFYKGDKLLFSSCTHERFHFDYSEDDEE